MATAADAMTLCNLLARRHRLKIVPVSEKSRTDPRKFERAYVVYRNHVRLGRRKDPADLLRFIESLVPAEAQLHAS